MTEKATMANKQLIQPVSVDLGVQSIKIPVARLIGNQPGPSILITGGMDGDEYAGIEAAYQLVDRLKNDDFAGHITIIPVVNIPGFAAECSQNPLDQKFPKNIFPGKINGSPTDQLVYWLAANFVQGANCWIDLHGGAITEGLNPFLMLYKTGNKQVDSLTEKIKQASVTERLIYSKSMIGSKISKLAKLNCTYILAESGERGMVDRSAIDHHVETTMSIMQLLGMLENAPIKSVEQTIYTHAAYHLAPFDGLWRPSANFRSTITKGSIIGTCTTLDGSKTIVMRAQKTGFPLWWKETLSMRKGDVLCALAN